MIFLEGRRRSRTADTAGRALVSPDEWRRPAVRWGVGGAQGLLLVGLVVVGLGPLLWLAKSAITPTADTLSQPMALFPHGTAWSNLREAWTTVEVGRYFWNTVVLAIGSWADPDLRRDHRRLRALGPAAQVRAHCSTRSC